MWLFIKEMENRTVGDYTTCCLCKSHGSLRKGSGMSEKTNKC